MDMSNNGNGGLFKICKTSFCDTYIVYVLHTLYLYKILSTLCIICIRSA